MKKSIAILLPICSLMLTGCFSSKDDSSSSSPNSDNPSDSITSSEVIDKDPVIINSEDYLLFWNNTTNLSFNITMSQEAANFINSYQSNHDDSTYFDYYVPCTLTLTMNGVTTTYEEVGIRQKGNMSRRESLVDNNFSLDKLVHYKLSFKETFDDDEYSDISILQPFKKTWLNSSDKKARKERRLFDMEKIDIKWNRNDDQSKVKQSYALKAFRENGVLAGHSTLANVTLGIEGKTPITTTYEILECIDSVFIKRNFNAANADGDLYKCTYTGLGPANFSNSYSVGSQIGVEDNTRNYHPVYDLKTNKKKNTTHTNLLNLRAAINNRQLSATEYESFIKQYLHMDSFMMYEAIAYLLGNFDDMRNNANNYYLYIASNTKMAYIIPYDFDRCLGAGCEGRKDYMTDFSAESTKMQCNGDWQTINLYWRTVCTSTNSSSGHTSVQRVENFRAMYQKNIEDLLNNKRISNEDFTNFVNGFPSEYRGNPDGAGKDNISFANYLSKKINAIKTDTYTSGYNINV